MHKPKFHYICVVEDLSATCWKHVGDRVGDTF